MSHKKLKKIKKKKILINGKWFSIEHVCIEKTHPELGDDIWGVCVSDQRAIYLDHDIPDAEYHETMGHEVSHAILRTNNIDEVLEELLGPEKALEIEELICDAFGASYRAFKAF